MRRNECLTELRGLVDMLRDVVTAMREKVNRLKYLGAERSSEFMDRVIDGDVEGCGIDGDVQGSGDVMWTGKRQLEEEPVQLKSEFVVNMLMM